MNKEMTTGIIIIALGIIIMAIMGAIGNSYIQKGRTLKAQENKKEIIGNQDSSKIEILDSMESGKAEILKSTDNIKKTQNEIKKMAKKSKPDIKVENSPNSIVQINEDGDNIINQKTEEFNPKIVFFKNEIQTKKDNSGKITTKFFFGSEKGAALMNPSVHIFFDGEFEDASGGVTGEGMVLAGNLSKNAGPTKKDYIIRTNMLQPGNYFFIQTTSDKELKVINLVMKP